MYKRQAQYTVTEKELPKGFELTAVDKKADAKEAAGTIVSGKSVKDVYKRQALGKSGPKARSKDVVDG